MCKKIEIGSGKHPLQGYDHFEINSKHPHIEFNDYNQIPDNTYDKLYARHVLEHMTKNEAIEAIRQWHRILKHEGIIQVIVPNLEFHIEQLSKEGKSPYGNWTNYDHGMAGLYGWQRDKYDIHKWGYTYRELMSLLREEGFKGAISCDDTRACDLSIWGEKLK